jgi:hypothetical protein
MSVADRGDHRPDRARRPGSARGWTHNDAAGEGSQIVTAE